MLGKGAFKVEQFASTSNQHFKILLPLSAAQMIPNWHIFFHGEELDPHISFLAVIASARFPLAK